MRIPARAPTDTHLNTHSHSHSKRQHFPPGNHVLHLHSLLVLPIPSCCQPSLPNIVTSTPTTNDLETPFPTSNPPLDDRARQAKAGPSRMHAARKLSPMYSLSSLFGEWGRYAWSWYWNHTMGLHMAESCYRTFFCVRVQMLCLLPILYGTIALFVLTWVSPTASPPLPTDPSFLISNSHRPRKASQLGSGPGSHVLAEHGRLVQGAGAAHEQLLTTKRRLLLASETSPATHQHSRPSTRRNALGFG